MALQRQSHAQRSPRPRDVGILIVVSAALLAVAMLMVILNVIRSHSESSMIGRASVIDGDTITLVHSRVRIFGIDAPELAQPCYFPSGSPWPCGLEAKQMLTRFIADDPVTCISQDQDTYNRKVSICYVRGDDVGHEMVLQGMAIAYRRYSQRYVPEETRAITERRGMWVGRFDPPYIWRQQNRKQP